MSPTMIMAYLALFATVGILFLFVNLFVGKLVRPDAPNAEKLEIYECGEPTIGSSFVQFDLRFYVVALLFIIFDVEVSLFFPWAVVFGSSTNLADPAFQSVVETVSADGTSSAQLAAAAVNVYQSLGVPNPTLPLPGEGVAANLAAVRESASLLGALAIGDIVVFFAVLLVGFAYVWRRGDLDWVRAVSLERAKAPRRPVEPPVEEEALLV